MFEQVVKSNTQATLYRTITDNQAASHRYQFAVVVKTPSHDHSGIAHALEHLLLRQNTKYPDPCTLFQIRAFLQVNVTATTLHELTLFCIDSLNRADFELALDYLLHALFSPILTQEAIESEVFNSNEQGVIWHELAKQELDSELLFWRNLIAKQKKFHCHGGLKSHIKSICLEYASTYYKKYYQLSNMQFYFDNYAENELLKRILAASEIPQPNPPLPEFEPRLKECLSESAYAPDQKFYYLWWLENQYYAMVKHHLANLNLRLKPYFSTAYLMPEYYCQASDFALVVLSEPSVITDIQAQIVDFFDDLTKPEAPRLKIGFVEGVIQHSRSSISGVSYTYNKPLFLQQLDSYPEQIPVDCDSDIRNSAVLSQKQTRTGKFKAEMSHSTLFLALSNISPPKISQPFYFETECTVVGACPKKIAVHFEKMGLRAKALHSRLFFSENMEQLCIAIKELTKQPGAGFWLPIPFAFNPVIAESEVDFHWGTEVSGNTVTIKLEHSLPSRFLRVWKHIPFYLLCIPAEPVFSENEWVIWRTLLIGYPIFLSARTEGRCYHIDTQYSAGTHLITYSVAYFSEQCDWYRHLIESIRALKSDHRYLEQALPASIANLKRKHSPVLCSSSPIESAFNDFTDEQLDGINIQHIQSISNHLVELLIDSHSSPNTEYFYEP